MKISVRMVPYIIVCLMLSYTWYIILSTEYQATWKHHVALGIVVLNFAAYLMRFNYGLAITGVLLLLATFNAVGLLPNIVYTSYFIRIAGKKMESPPIQGKSFLLFLLYFVLNWSYWTEQYKLYKSSKMDRE